MVKVLEIKTKVFLLENVLHEDLLSCVTDFIDETLAQNEHYLKLHEEKCYKNYCFGGFFPVERNGLYTKGSIYEFTVRTCDKALADYLAEKLPEHSNGIMKGLIGEVRIIPQMEIATVYTLTPVIVKSSSKGYWRDSMNLTDFESRMKINLVKKYRGLTGQAVSEDFQLFNLLNFTNNGPIPMKYKGIKLLGDKMELHVANNTMAQELTYMALGTGLCEMNARGFGFLSCRYL